MDDDDDDEILLTENEESELHEIYWNYLNKSVSPLSLRVTVPIFFKSKSFIKNQSQNGKKYKNQS